MRGIRTAQGTEIFSSPKEMAFGAEAIVKYLKNQRKKGNLSSSGIFGFILERSSVLFTKKVKDVELYMDYGKGNLTVLSPKPKNPKDAESQRVKLLREFASVIPEAQLRSTLYFWASLTPQAKKKFLAQSFKKSKKDRQKKGKK